MKKFIKGVLLLAALFSVSVSASEFKEGVHYQVFPVQKTKTPTVTEYFSFYCGNCYNMETRYLPLIKPELDKDISFNQKHVDYAQNQTSKAVVEAFAIMQEMGIEDDARLKEVMFEAMGGNHDHHSAPKGHEEKGPSVATLQDIKTILVANGVDAASFDKAAKSPVVAEKVAKWDKEQSYYRINSIPTFVVNGKYKIIFKNLKTVEQLTDLMNYLADK
ncbi:thiol:disulfide interchange protein DsbA/DsbL [Vibrio sp. SS-MA-C1-2]|uniref:thiol:disulfide interchange protein DsbA/DsbL n=1 Tax=Vibrio sp. SS-MA-C1-2 TaxID=2908646 RepID=UPI001F48A73D|nr:thiol:disulfide interchange protein DsbA/DsbL [Vibrio sp. SS-MA-C1-2]UJF17737.1 thiol:disulfide interchange protein DsbA/DsbL [Vibrio sp. SS-MA-C1-2]